MQLWSEKLHMPVNCFHSASKVYYLIYLQLLCLSSKYPHSIHIAETNFKQAEMSLFGCTVHLSLSRSLSIPWQSLSLPISHMTKFNHYNPHQSKSVTCITLVLTWFWALLAFVEPPGCSDALTAFLLLAETREGLAALAFIRERERNRERERERNRERERKGTAEGKTEWASSVFSAGKKTPSIFLHLAGWS